MTMNLQVRGNVIKLAALLGVLIWVLDGALDSLFFYEESFLGLTFTNVPPHELYVRLFWFGGLLVIGLFASRIINDKERALADKREMEKSLRQSGKKYRQIFNSAKDAMYLHELTEEGTPGRCVGCHEIKPTVQGSFTQGRSNKRAEGERRNPV